MFNGASSQPVDSRFRGNDEDQEERICSSFPRKARPRENGAGIHA